MTSATINNGNTMPVEPRPGIAIAIPTTPSMPNPASPALPTPEQKAAKATRHHSNIVKSGSCIRGRVG